MMKKGAIYFTVYLLARCTLQAEPSQEQHPPPPPPPQDFGQPIARPSFRCGGKSGNRYLGPGNHNYRDNGLAKYMQERKRVLTEITTYQDPKQAFEWLKTQNFLDENELDLIHRQIEGDSTYRSLCDGGDVAETIRHVFGPDMIRVPVLIGEYPDAPMTNSATDINNKLFGSSPTNVTAYFDETSYGQMSLTGDVLGPYTSDTPLSDFDRTSYLDAEVFILELLAKADPYIDFSQYDSDGNNVVDALCVIGSAYLGPGGGHQGNINYITDDGVEINEYTFMAYEHGNNDTLTAFCHEFGHILGLPDLYDGDDEVWYWDIMAYGYNLSHFSAWSKIELGWLYPKYIQGNADNLTIRNAEYHAEAYKLSEGGLPLDEYFLVENRQQAGFDECLPGPGLIIYHVSPDKIVIEGADDAFNPPPGWGSGDPFPGDYDNREFSDSTMPDSRYDDGTSSGIEVKNISRGYDISADIYVPEIKEKWRGLNSNSRANLYGISFINENMGWVVGAEGTILHTADGGTNWTSQSSRTNATLYDVCFVNPTIGWTLGNNGLILKTTNGTTWFSQNSGTSASLRALSAVDTTHAWIIDNRETLLRTSNGGSTWQILSPGIGQSYQDIHFLDRNEGYILCEDSTLLHTTNGGHTWSAQVLVDDNNDGNGDATTFGMHVDTNRIWIVGEDGHMIYVSGSTVVSYQESTYPGSVAVSLYGDVGAVVGSDIFTFDKSALVCEQITTPFTNVLPVIACSDGSWSNVGVSLDLNLKSVKFVSEHIGYAVGYNGTILKYDANYIDHGPSSDWEVIIDDDRGTGRDVATDAEGNSYVTGCFTGTRNFNPLGSARNLTSLGDRDGFIAKYDNNGDLDWAWTMAGYEDDYGRSVAVASDGSVYVAGSFKGAAIFYWLGPFPIGLTSQGNSDAYVIKFDRDGNCLWLKQIGGSGSDGAKGVAVDSNNDVYITGYFQNTVDFNPGSSTHNITSAGNSDGYVMKLHANGNFGWARRIGGSSDDVSYGIAVDSSRVYVCGYHKSASCYVGTYADGTSVSLFNHGDADIFVASYYESSGYVSWAQYYGGSDEDKAFDLTVDNQNHVYVTGHYNDTASFSSASLSAGGRSSDTFVCKLQTDGSMVWAKSNRQSGSGTDNNGVSTGRGIAVTPNGCSVYVTGQYQGNVDFDPSSGTEWMYGPVCAYCGCAKVFLWSLENDGTFLDAQDRGGDGMNMGQAVTISQQNNIYVTGYYSDQTDCGEEEKETYGQIFLWKQ